MQFDQLARTIGAGIAQRPPLWLITGEETLSMLEAADKGILFCPPANVVADYPQYPVVTDINDLKQRLIEIVSQ